jgi:hypothetical protein
MPARDRYRSHNNLAYFGEAATIERHLEKHKIQAADRGAQRLGPNRASWTLPAALSRCSRLGGVTSYPAAVVREGSAWTARSALLAPPVPSRRSPRDRMQEGNGHDKKHGVTTLRGPIRPIPTGVPSRVVEATARAGECGRTTRTKTGCESAPTSPASPWAASWAKGGATKTGTRFRVPRREPASGHRRRRRVSTFHSGVPAQADEGPTPASGPGSPRRRGPGRPSPLRGTAARARRDDWPAGVAALVRQVSVELQGVRNTAGATSSPPTWPPRRASSPGKRGRPGPRRTRP